MSVVLGGLMVVLLLARDVLLFSLALVLVLGCLGDYVVCLALK